MRESAFGVQDGRISKADRIEASTGLPVYTPAQAKRRNAAGMAVIGATGAAGGAVAGAPSFHRATTFRRASARFTQDADRAGERDISFENMADHWKARGDQSRYREHMDRAAEQRTAVRGHRNAAGLASTEAKRLTRVGTKRAAIGAAIGGAAAVGGMAALRHNSDNRRMS